MHIETVFRKLQLKEFNNRAQSNVVIIDNPFIKPTKTLLMLLNKA